MEKTIESVLAQSRKPLVWVIVNDASTDRTGVVADHYARKNAFIISTSTQRNGNHSFSNKARAFNTGLELLRGTEYDVIGNLDADVSFEANYFENLIRAFEQDVRLGISGGIIYTKIKGRFITGDETLDSVAGAVQLFRKECFEDVGGAYLPLPYGGIDAAAEIIAKAKGWKVRKSTADKVFEHRQTGTAAMKPLAAAYRLGHRFHSLGYGMLFYTLRCLYRLKDDPILVGSCAAFFGFVESLAKQRPILLPDQVVAHLRAEQRRKLLQSLLPWRRG